MGLDGTIKRADERPLGDVEAVQRALADTFPGVTFGMLPSGQSVLDTMAKYGPVPDVFRRNLESRPMGYGGVYEGQCFSAEFDLGPEEIVSHIDIILRGTTTAAAPMLRLLNEQYGWIITHP